MQSNFNKIYTKTHEVEVFETDNAAMSIIRRYDDNTKSYHIEKAYTRFFVSEDLRQATINHVVKESEAYLKQPLTLKPQKQPA